MAGEREGSVVLVKSRDCLAAKSAWSGRLMYPGIQRKAHEDEEEDKE